MLLDEALVGGIQAFGKCFFQIAIGALLQDAEQGVQLLSTVESSQLKIIKTQYDAIIKWLISSQILTINTP